ncbi:MAG TPA: hypothetical protein O0X27_03970 [Methanocorpusculum sp.]|nr:hypothetical protein [Methanocorpusculum sp.]
MNVGKLWIIGVIALIVAGCVLAAGCTDTNSITSSSQSTVVTDADGNVISSSASGDFTVNTDKFGMFKVSITDKDPVVGIWSDDGNVVLYKLYGNSSATRYELTENGDLINPVSVKWGKVQGKDNTYLINNEEAKTYVRYIYYPEEDVLREYHDDDKTDLLVLKRATVVTKSEPVA